MGNYVYPFDLTKYFTFLNDSGKKQAEKASVQELGDDAEEDLLYESFLGIVYRMQYGGWFPYYSSGDRWHGAVDIPCSQRSKQHTDDNPSPAGNLFPRAIADGTVMNVMIDSTYSGWANGGGIIVTKHQAPDGNEFYCRYIHLRSWNLLEGVSDSDHPTFEEWKKWPDDKKVRWTKELNYKKKIPSLQYGAALTAGQDIAPLGWLVSGHHLHLEVVSKHRWDVMEPSIEQSAAESLMAQGKFDHSARSQYFSVTNSKLSGGWWGGKDDHLGKSGWTYYHPIHFIHAVLKGDPDLNTRPTKPKFTGKGEGTPKPTPHAEGGDVAVKKVITAEPLDIPEVHKLSVNKSFTKDEMHSKAVEAVQQVLYDLGYSLGTSGKNKNGVDGSYGNRTTKAIAKFQTANKAMIEKYLAIARVVVPSLPEEVRTDGSLDWPTLVALSLAWVGQKGGATSTSANPKETESPRTEPSGTEAFVNPQWIKRPVNSGDEAQMQVDAPGMEDGVKVQFVVERFSDSFGWGRVAEVVAETASQKAVGKVAVEMPVVGGGTAAAERLRFRAKLYEPPAEEPAAAGGDDWTFPHPSLRTKDFRAPTPKFGKSGHALEGGMDYPGFMWPQIPPTSALPKDLIAIPMLEVEGGKFDSVNLYDAGILTWGFSQWTVHAGSLQKVLRYMKQEDAETFDKVFKAQGIDIRVDARRDTEITVDGKTITTQKEMRVAFKGTDVDHTPTKDNPTPTDWTAEEREAMRKWIKVFASAAYHPKIQALQQKFAIEKEIDSCLTVDLDKYAPNRYGLADRFRGKNYAKIFQFHNGQLWTQALLYGLWVNNRVLAFMYFADAVDACRASGDMSRLGDVFYEKVIDPESKFISTWRQDRDGKGPGRAQKIKAKFEKILAGRTIAGIVYEGKGKIASGGGSSATVPAPAPKSTPTPAPETTAEAPAETPAAETPAETPAETLPPTPVEGFDIAFKGHGTIDWDAVSKKYGFAFLRAEYRTHLDEGFKKSWKEMEPKPIVRGAYQFWLAEDDGAADAKSLKATLGDIRRGVDLPPALDLEFSAKRGKPLLEKLGVKETMRRFTEYWRAIVDAFDVYPIIYTSERVWHEELKNIAVPNPEMLESPLWLARYVVAAGSPKLPVPKPWGARNWWIHQYKGDVDHAKAGVGTKGDVDLNRFQPLGDEASEKSGERIKWLQRRLKIAASGEWGPETVEALKDYQKKSGLEPTGVVDPRTFAKIAWEKPAAAAAPSGPTDAKGAFVSGGKPIAHAAFVLHQGSSTGTPVTKDTLGEGKTTLEWKNDHWLADAEGKYLFTGMPGGQYFVELVTRDLDDDVEESA